MTNQTSPFPGASRPPRRAPSFWLRATPLQRAGVVAAALVLPCCGGVAVIGSLAGGQRPVVATAPAGLAPAPAGLAPAPAAGRLAGDRTAPKPGRTLSPRTTTPSHRATPSPGPPPAVRLVVTRRVITTRTSVAYATRTVPDATLAEGDTRVRTRGATGIRTRTYEIVLAGGTETSRKLIRSMVTKRPVSEVVAVGTRAEPATGGCDLNYTPCVPVASDVDCAGGGGNGPAYVAGPVEITGDDVYDLDRDGDGVGCDG